MLWTKAMLGTDIYHIIQWFLIYSMLGWLVESIYMSICNRKLTNRGFMRSPACPIYGVGALTVYFLLKPICHNLYLLYFFGCAVPTLLEFATAKLMLRLFGEVWWDYSKKPFNYRGILCLESTVAWGFYTLGLFLFLQRGVEHVVNSYSFEAGTRFGGLLLLIFTVDFVHTLYEKKKESLPSSLGELREGIRALYGR